MRKETARRAKERVPAGQMVGIGSTRGPKVLESQKGSQKAEESRKERGKAKGSSSREKEKEKGNSIRIGAGYAMAMAIGVMNVPIVRTMFVK